mgnify:CR=1 FL=1
MRTVNRRDFLKAASVMGMAAATQGAGCRTAAGCAVMRGVLSESVHKAVEARVARAREKLRAALKRYSRF